MPKRNKRTRTDSQRKGDPKFKFTFWNFPADSTNKGVDNDLDSRHVPGAVGPGSTPGRGAAKVIADVHAHPYL